MKYLRSTEVLHGVIIVRTRCGGEGKSIFTKLVCSYTFYFSQMIVERAGFLETQDRGSRIGNRGSGKSRSGIGDLENQDRVQNNSKSKFANRGRLMTANAGGWRVGKRARSADLRRNQRLWTDYAS